MPRRRLAVVVMGMPMIMGVLLVAEVPAVRDIVRATTDCAH
ncbi:hypothetical protein [Sorangium cellulosum]|nr:hypothetical protein [Sorangium cellulosum]